MNKWDYIEKIRKLSCNADLLLDMLNKYDKQGLINITLQEAKEYYENLVEKKENNL